MFLSSFFLCLFVDIITLLPYFRKFFLRAPSSVSSGNQKWHFDIKALQWMQRGNHKFSIEITKFSRYILLCMCDKDQILLSLRGSFGMIANRFHLFWCNYYLCWFLLMRDENNLFHSITICGSIFPANTIASHHQMFLFFSVAMICFENNVCVRSKFWCGNAMKKQFLFGFYLIRNIGISYCLCYFYMIDYYVFSIHMQLTCL